MAKRKKKKPAAKAAKTAKSAKATKAEATDNQKELDELKKKVEDLTSQNEDLQALLASSKSKDAGAAGGDTFTRAQLEAHVSAMEKACRGKAEEAIAATAEQARQKIEALRDEARALRSRVDALEGKKKGKGKAKARTFTEEEVLQHVNAMERACREEAEKALKATSDRAREEIRKWKGEVKRLEVVNKAYQASS